MDPSSSAPVQKDDESYDLSMSIDILKNVVRNYSPKPLQKLVAPRLASKPLLVKAFLDLDLLSQQQRSFFTQEIVNVEAPPEVVSRPVHPDEFLLILGKAMVVPDWTKLNDDDQEYIIELLAREPRVSKEDGELDEVVIDFDEQPTTAPQARAEEAALILPETMATVTNSSRRWKTAFEFLALLAGILARVISSMIMNAGSYRTGTEETMAIKEAAALLPKWVRISCILEPLLTALIQWLVVILGNALLEAQPKESEVVLLAVNKKLAQVTDVQQETAAEMKETAAEMKEQLEQLVRKQQGGRPAADP